MADNKDKNDEVEKIIEFWFGTLPDGKSINEEKQKKWFVKDSNFDAEIHGKFKALWNRAKNRELENWLDDPMSNLALVVLLDQFSRNMFRNKEESFNQDKLALEYARRALEKKFDLVIYPLFAVFFYMPFMHAESIEAQWTCVDKFLALAKSAPKPLQSLFENFHSYAKKHLEIIDRFGRFPHRNKILHRISTAEESKFLEEPGSSF